MSNYNTKEPNCKCRTCGIGMIKKPFQLKTGKPLFCSRGCVSVHQSNTQYDILCEKVSGDFKTWLNQKYNVEKLTSQDMAEIVYGKRKNDSNITNWMKKLGVPIRDMSEAISMTWESDIERKQEYSLLFYERTKLGTPARDKLIAVMQTASYKAKISYANSGSKSGRWKPELSDDDRERNRYSSRQYPGYSQFRIDVYRRDNYTCQTCGDDTGGNLVVHHLDGFHWAVGLRTDVDNGVTLCDVCHKSFHSLYGVKNNTKEQFEQYLNKALVK